MSTLVKVILAIAVICVGTVVMLGVFGLFVARNVHFNESGSGPNKTVSIDSPFGHVKVHENSSLDPEQVGIPVYPGASRSKDKGGADFQIDAGDLHKDLTIAGASYFTSDSVDKVRDFYQHKFPSWSTKWSNSEFQIETKEDGRIRSISVKREGDGTRIGVASVGPPAAN